MKSIFKVCTKSLGTYFSSFLLFLSQFSKNRQLHSKRPHNLSYKLVRFFGLKWSITENHTGESSKLKLTLTVFLYEKRRKKIWEKILNRCKPLNKTLASQEMFCAFLYKYLEIKISLQCAWQFSLKVAMYTILMANCHSYSLMTSHPFSIIFFPLKLSGWYILAILGN